MTDSVTDPRVARNSAADALPALPAPVVALLGDLDLLLTDAHRALPGGPGPRLRTADVVQRLEQIRDRYHANTKVVKP